MWKDIIKNEKQERIAHVKKYPFTKDYRYGRCQANDGTGCIRNLQSPERREYARSKPDGKTCMYCEDDHYRYGDVPKEIWSSEQWKKGDKETRRKMLDKYVKRNPRYNMRDFEPF